MTTAVGTGSPIPDLGPPGVHGICFSCDSIKDMDIAEETATRLGSTATWYSVGVLATDQELALRCAEFCRRHGLHALFHPLDLDVCGTDPLDDRLLRLLGERADELNSPWLNIDLAMWVREGETLLESLVPMPLVDEAVDWAVDRIKHAQDVIGRPLTIENAPYPFVVGDRDILTLMTRIAERADCLMTIDVGHLYGLRVQRGLPPVLPSDDDIAWDRVVEAHMSGTFVRRFEGGVRLVDDKHDWPVSDEVWELADALLPRAPHLRSVMAEAEGMTADELTDSVRRFARRADHWWSAS
ncbi:multinuclear nonheme iron-dependent oxidase [Streptomyces phaeochromogenes]|uniref:multinuclear nonheme iron-dependent oxidase n=1 Tax=Streptomyces phaeochromogenes TaxID=1923 RepID=UPI00371DD1E4